MTDQIFFILLLSSIFLLAGIIKGAAGLGLPTAAMGLMTITIAPRMAIALLIFPLIFTNAWQIYRSGNIYPTFKKYFTFIFMLIIFVWLTVNKTTEVSDNILIGFLGASVLLFVIANIFKNAPFIPIQHDQKAQIISGFFAGVMGGLTSVWAPPLAIYLAARRIPKEEFVRVSGLIFFIGSIPLLLAYLAQGHLNKELSIFSMFLLLPTFVGFWLGEKIRNKMSEIVFKKFILVLFFSGSQYCSIFMPFLSAIKKCPGGTSFIDLIIVSGEPIRPNARY